MSASLWKYYYNEELDNFRQLLCNHGQKTPKSNKVYGERVSSCGSLKGFSASPRSAHKCRKASNQCGHLTDVKGSNSIIGYAEINFRDYAGLTILHRAASSTSKIKISFAMILIEHPAIDLYLQDTENGWTALHRALYFGNVSLARAIIEKDVQSTSGTGGTKPQKIFSNLVRIKDFEGNNPFDLYNATITRNPVKKLGNENEENKADIDIMSEIPVPSGLISRAKLTPSIDGDEVFAWGSSRNHGLGFKDQDDRHYPERIILKRPDELYYTFYRDYLKSQSNDGYLQDRSTLPKSISDLPTLISHRPILIQDVVLSKFHSAILTTDSESNLYMCGFGPGGRLGTGDEDTRFSYVPINSGPLAGKQVSKVALGQNHTLAVINDGSLLSWGSNLYGQLGYNLPRPTLSDKEQICAFPRQIFGPLKREIIVGVAASTLHSVAHSSTSLFTWGKNEGQLGLMDSDSRSLETQPTPRKVAMSLFKGPIDSVSAINNATIVLLSNHSVCVFSNYGYNIVKFPLSEEPSRYPLRMNYFTTGYNPKSNFITSIAAGGDTIGAVSSNGDLYTLNVQTIPSNSTTSTTNPTKIRESLSAPERIWTARKGSFDGVKSVGIIENGLVILCTRAGAVWRHFKRVSVKDSNKSNGISKSKNIEFQRIPGLANIATVRSTVFGVFVAIQRNWDFLEKKIPVKEQTLWMDVAPLNVLNDLQISEPAECKIDQILCNEKTVTPEPLASLRRVVLTVDDLEALVGQHLRSCILDKTLNINIGTTVSEVKIPVHSCMLGRSPILREILASYRETGKAINSDILSIENAASLQSLEGSDIKATLTFKGLDFITVFNLVLYLYTDTLVDVWQFTRYYPAMKFRYRQVRAELIKVANQFKLEKLEIAVRAVIEPEKIMDREMNMAIQHPAFFEDGDVIIELKNSEVKAHSAILCQRCPFFEGLFKGRAAGKWLSSRRQENREVVRVDLKHIEPNVFNIVLDHIYTDLGIELFEGIISSDIDEFSDLVLDVMSIANELILNRLSQICQDIIGRFVNVRNVSNLLNFIAPCSVAAFKQFALKFICINLESILENHLLNDLEEDVLFELDHLVRLAQLDCLPFAKSDRADRLLHENHPQLAEEIKEERRCRLSKWSTPYLRNDSSRSTNSPKACMKSPEIIAQSFESQEILPKIPQRVRSTQFSPSVQKRNSVTGMIFNMDDDDDACLSDSALASGNNCNSDPNYLITESSKTIYDETDLLTPKKNLSTSFSRMNEDEGPSEDIKSSGKGWSPIVFPTSKLGMREIMEQTHTSRHSFLSMGISAQNVKDDSESRSSSLKISQKERKKQRHQQALNRSQATNEVEENPKRSVSSPWKVTPKGEKIILKEILCTSSSQAIEPVTRSEGQAQTNFQSAIDLSRSKRRTSENNYESSTSRTNKVEPALVLSMADIIVQQKREIEIIKDATSKRSLREIQEEQAFQEWWDQESKRISHAEAAARRAADAGLIEKHAGSSRGRPSRRRRGKSSRPKEATSS
ncbi:hypothetical protein K3495_g3364 [Podosphaera aphanis]|nr:hypothetical protein K3495_g3364 [Podosphaera aphanis]